MNEGVFFSQKFLIFSFHQTEEKDSYIIMYRIDRRMEMGLVGNFNLLLGDLLCSFCYSSVYLMINMQTRQ